jgi:hypothetical protein
MPWKFLKKSPPYPNRGWASLSPCKPFNVMLRTASQAYRPGGSGIALEIFEKNPPPTPYRRDRQSPGKFLKKIPPPIAEERENFEKGSPPLQIGGGKFLKKIPPPYSRGRKFFEKNPPPPYIFSPHMHIICIWYAGDH